MNIIGFTIQSNHSIGEGLDNVFCSAVNFKLDVVLNKSWVGPTLNANIGEFGGLREHVRVNGLI